MCRFRRARRMQLVVSVQDNSVFQMTALCLSASFCFLVCVTPSMVLLIGKPYWNVPPSDWYAISKSITNQVCNHRACLHNQFTLKIYQNDSIRLSRSTAA